MMIFPKELSSDVNGGGGGGGENKQQHPRNEILVKMMINELIDLFESVFQP